MTIDRDQPIPIYFQLKTLLLEEILGGVYDPEKRLPTEHELCERFAVSRTPVTKALGELVDEGVIIRHRRRGTFVNPHWLVRSPAGPEIRLLLPDGPWHGLVQRATPDQTNLSIATAPLEQLLEVVRRAVGEGRAPDIALVDSVWIPELAAAGFLWPMEDLDPDWFESNYMSDFLEPLDRVNRYRGKSYAVQAEADVAGVWMRRDHLDQVGMDPPRDWESMVALLRALASRPAGPRHPLVFPGGSRGGETTTYCLLALLASNGIEVAEGDAITLDAPGAAETLGYLRGLVDTDLVSPEVVSYEWDRPIRMLAAGEASLSFGGSYEGRTLSAYTGLAMENLTDHFVFLPMPAGPNGTAASLAGGMAYTIFRQAHDQKRAMSLLEHLLAPSALVEMARSSGQIPPRRTAATLVGGEIPFIADTVTMLRRAVVRPAIPAYARTSRQLQIMIEGVLTDRFTPEAAIDRTTELIAAITGMKRT